MAYVLTMGFLICVAIVIVFGVTFGLSYLFAWLLIDVAAISLGGLTTFQLSLIIFVLMMIFGGGGASASRS